MGKKHKFTTKEEAMTNDVDRGSARARVHRLNKVLAGLERTVKDKDPENDPMLRGVKRAIENFREELAREEANISSCPSAV